jgi:hemolysin activation/secretion protein
VGGSAAWHRTIPLPLHPVLGLRGTARKVFGEFPFHESAFLGGRGSVRVLDPQRYAGDASLMGSTELQIPFPTIPIILPIATGIYGFADAGRVYLDGESPGGWHSGVGGGFWIGVLRSQTALNFEFGRYQGETRVRVRSGLNF